MRAGSLSSPLFSSSRHCWRVRSDPMAEQIEIDIAAGQHETDALARQFCLFLHRRGESARAAPFGWIMCIGPVGADRGSDLIVRNLHDARGALADQRERILVG